MLSSAHRGKNESDIFDFLEMLDKWPEMIGEKMAKVTEPVKIKGKSLVVITAHSAFSQQLSLMKTEILKKINKVYPQSIGKIKDLTFITNDLFFAQKKKDILSDESKKEYKKNNQLHPHSPRYRQLFKEAQNIFQDIKDAEIKQSLTKIYITSRND